LNFIVELLSRDKSKGTWLTYDIYIVIQVI